MHKLGTRDSRILAERVIFGSSLTERLFIAYGCIYIILCMYLFISFGYLFLSDMYVCLYVCICMYLYVLCIYVCTMHLCNKEEKRT